MSDSDVGDQQMFITVLTNCQNFVDVPFISTCGRYPVHERFPLSWRLVYEHDILPLKILLVRSRMELLCCKRETSSTFDAGDCPLRDIRHGWVISDIDIYGKADATSHDQQIHYQCEDGYVNDTAVPRCVNGTWTAEAVCRPGKAHMVLQRFDYDPTIR